MITLTIIVFLSQTYGIHHQKNGEVELLSYVDSIDVDSPAAKSGLREGDVILSINGVDVERADHRTLIDYIKSCQGTMRMVVLFEDCVRKVELHRRFLKLKVSSHFENNRKRIKRFFCRQNS